MVDWRLSCPQLSYWCIEGCCQNNRSERGDDVEDLGTDEEVGKTRLSKRLLRESFGPFGMHAPCDCLWMWGEAENSWWQEQLFLSLCWFKHPAPLAKLQRPELEEIQAQPQSALAYCRCFGCRQDSANRSACSHDVMCASKHRETNRDLWSLYWTRLIVGTPRVCCSSKHLRLDMFLLNLPLHLLPPGYKRETIFSMMFSLQRTNLMQFKRCRDWWRDICPFFSVWIIRRSFTTPTHSLSPSVMISSFGPQQYLGIGGPNKCLGVQFWGKHSCSKNMEMFLSSQGLSKRLWNWKVIHHSDQTSLTGAVLSFCTEWEKNIALQVLDESSWMRIAWWIKRLPG